MSPVAGQKRKRSPLRYLHGYPDRIIVSESVADKLEDIVRDGESEGGIYYWVPINRSLKLLEALDEIGIDRPSWADKQTIRDAEWRQVLLKEPDPPRGFMWVFATSVIIQHPFALSLHQWLTEDLKGPVYWSEYLNAWIITKPTESDLDLLINEIADEYEMTLSPGTLDMGVGRSGWEEILSTKVEAAEDLGLKLPESFPSGRKLEKWQKSGVLALAGMGGGLLADQVGLGKGSEFICAARSLHEAGLSAFPVVLVCNATMKEELAEESLKWLYNPVIVVLEGKTGEPIDPDVDVIVVNVDIVSDWLDDIIDVGPKGLIVDEGHTMKNEDAKRTKAVQALADHIRENVDRGGYVCIATGTPFLNRPIELWSLLGILGVRDIFTDHALKALAEEGQTTVTLRTKRGKQETKIWARRAFEMRWCDGHYDQYKAWHNEGFSHTRELNTLLLQHVMVRRKKSDVFSPLPPLYEYPHMVDELDEEAYQEYLDQERHFREWAVEEARQMAEEEGMSEQAAIRSVLRKLQSGGEGIMRMTAMRQSIAKAKLPWTVDFVHKFMEGDPQILGEQVEGRTKMILFAFHREIQQALYRHPEFRRYAPASIFSKAEQGLQSIQAEKRRFQEDPACRLIVCSLGAAREGHTLTAAKDIALVELPFVPAWCIQTAGRCWARMSELYPPHEAHLHYIVARNTVDDVNMSRLHIKRSGFDAIIDGEDVEDLSDFDLGDRGSVQTLVDALYTGKRRLRISG